ncbi:basic leucine zipper 6-like [Glycine soja]|uniref:basic leucine zipper 6-like n=1 Tax=Glycine soja TaxID=3848 RepID=UPI00103D27E5|nr:basic leucine zipper 6-like [Glycine soja]
MENPKENNKVENHHTVNAILSPTFVFSATKLADQFGYAEGNPTPEQQILDPKLRRIFSNRFAAQRSREKKKNHLANLEIQKKTFENEIAQKQQLQDLYENKRQTQIVEEETMYQEIDILKNYSMFKDAEIEKDKGEVIRERELQVIEKQEELQAHLVNLNIGPQEPVSNYPTSIYYANSYPVAANEVDPLESYIPPEPRELRFPAVPNLHDLNLSLPNNMGSVDQTNLTRGTALNHKP